MRIFGKIANMVKKMYILFGVYLRVVKKLCIKLKEIGQMVAKISCAKDSTFENKNFRDKFTNFAKIKTPYSLLHIFGF